MEIKASTQPVKIELQNLNAEENVPTPDQGIYTDKVKKEISESVKLEMNEEIKNFDACDNELDGDLNDE